MSKLKINEDDTITMPLTLGADGQPREVVLPEPSMRQLAEMHVLVAAADEQLGAIPNVSVDTSTAEELVEATKTLRERAIKSYSMKSPHGDAVIKIVHMLTGQTLTYDDLYGWAMNAGTCNQMLSHFQSPLPGRVTE